MKKLVILVFALFITVGIHAQNFSISSGVDALFNLYNLNYRNEADSDNYTTTDQADKILGFGIWFDATFARLSVDYTMSLNFTRHAVAVAGGTTVGDSEVDSPDGYARTNILITLVGKYPFDIGGIKIFPEVGLAYNYMMFLDDDGDGDNDLEEHDNEDVNDFYIIAGGGIDISVNFVVITAVIEFGYDLTPNIYTDEPASTESYSCWFLQFKLGVGYKFF